MNMLKKLSIFLNGYITGEKGYPLCYTAYKRKSVWYKIFNLCIFWEKDHCRRAYLSRELHDRRQK